MEGGAAAAEGDAVAPDELAALPSDGSSCIGRADSAMARTGGPRGAAAGRVVARETEPREGGGG